MKLLRFTYFTSLLFILLCFFSAVQNAQAQTLNRVEKGRMKDMLNTIKTEIKNNYYDANFRGIDIDGRFKKAEEKLEEATSIGQSYAIIAQVLIDFEDSHLYFSPPATNLKFEYGYRMKMVGDRAYITSVKPKSDADKKGLKPGDRILSIEGFRPNRKEFWKIGYYYNILNPKQKLRFSILRPNAEEAQNLEIEAKMTPLKPILNVENTQDYNDMERNWDEWDTRKRHYFRTVGDTVIWKMMTFSVEPTEIEQIMETKGKKAGNLIIDLRENGGGLVKSLEQLVSYFFDKEMKIADRKGREEKKKENKPMMSKNKGKDVFKGKLIVLIDSQSASASEIFARFIQLEKRGIILGDTSAGAVMQSMPYSLKLNSGDNREIWYSTSITNADVIMSDGKSVEHVGVIPDEKIIPSASDLANQRDPVLARAVELLGGELSAEEAGKFFPFDWDNY